MQGRHSSLLSHKRLYSGKMQPRRFYRECFYRQANSIAEFKFDLICQRKRIKNKVKGNEEQDRFDVKKERLKARFVVTRSGRGSNESRDKVMQIDDLQ